MLKRFRGLLIFALAMGLSFLFASDISAQAQPPSAPILIPVSIPREIKLNSLAVDIKLNREPLYLDFSCAYRFENTSKLESKSFSTQAVFPEKAERRALRLGGEASDPNKPTEITVEPGLKVLITLQASVPITGYPFLILSYPLPKDFARSIDSIRVTVHLPALTSWDELIQAEPRNFEFDGFRLTWRWIKEPFPPKIELYLIAPSLQEKLRELRGRTDAFSLYEIGTIYRTLAMAVAPETEIFKRFYREAIAYLERARSMDPSLYQVSLDLAALYYYKSLADEAFDLPALTLAAQEMEKAIKAGAPERNLAWTLQSIYLSLSRELQKEGFYEEAIAYLDKARVLAERGYPVPARAEEVNRLKRESSALLALNFLEEGEPQKAIALINEVFGWDFWEVLGVKLPLCHSAKALVKLKPGAGELECSCTPGLLYNPSDPDLTALPNPESKRIVIKFNFPLGTAHAPEREELASSLPVRSDFALCLAALRSSKFDWDERTEFLGKRYYLNGEVDTSEALKLMEFELAVLKKRENQLASDRILESETVQRLALKLLETGIQELEALEANSSLEIALETVGSEQRWFIKPGGKISFQREFRKLYPWVKPVVLLLALTALALMFVLLWRLRMLAQS